MLGVTGREDGDEDPGGLFTGCWGGLLSSTSVFVVWHYLFTSEKMQSPGCPQFTERGAELLKPFFGMWVMADPSLLQRLWRSCDPECIGLSLAGLRLPLLDLQHSTRFCVNGKRRKPPVCTRTD